MRDVERLRAEGQQSLSRKMLVVYRAYQGMAAQGYAARGYAGLGLAHTLLVASLDDGGTRIGALAERIGATKQFASRLVQELVERQLVTTAPDPADRRASVVTATEAGWEFLASACEARDEIEGRLGQILGAPRMAELQATFDLLIAQLPESPAPPPADG